MTDQEREDLREYEEEYEEDEEDLTGQQREAIEHLRSTR